MREDGREDVREGETECREGGTECPSFLWAFEGTRKEVRGKRMSLELRESIERT